MRPHTNLTTFLVYKNKSVRSFGLPKNFEMSKYGFAVSRLRKILLSCIPWLFLKLVFCYYVAPLEFFKIFSDIGDVTIEIR